MLKDGVNNIMNNGNSCTHPHIFRISVRDVYHCLACGKPIRVVPYDEIDPSSTLMVIKLKRSEQPKEVNKLWVNYI